MLGGVLVLHEPRVHVAVCVLGEHHRTLGRHSVLALRVVVVVDLHGGVILAQRRYEWTTDCMDKCVHRGREREGEGEGDRERA